MKRRNFLYSILAAIPMSIFGFRAKAAEPKFLFFEGEFDYVSITGHGEIYAYHILRLSNKGVIEKEIYITRDGLNSYRYNEWNEGFENGRKVMYKITIKLERTAVHAWDCHNPEIYQKSAPLVILKIKYI